MLAVNSDSTFDALLRQLPPGPVRQTGQLEQVLAAVWGGIAGSHDGGMTADKLRGRMEAVEWRPPVLGFRIERHGGAVLGSTRAEVQHWEVNVETNTATIIQTRNRQLTTPAAKVSVGLLAEEIARLILAGAEDARLKWGADGGVRVLAGKVFPSSSGYKRTVEGRRRRLCDEVWQRLQRHGWVRVEKSVFTSLNLIQSPPASTEQHTVV